MEIPITIIGFISFIPILDLTPAFHFKHCQQDACWRGLTLNKGIGALGARKICNKYGYDLVIINSNETQIFVEELLKSKDLELNRDSLFFIGLTRRTDQWLWLNGSHIENHRRNFYNWDINEPSTGSCVAVRIENFKWATLPCKSGFKFILCSTKNDQIATFSDEEEFQTGMKRKLRQVSPNVSESQDTALNEPEALSENSEGTARVGWIFSNVMTAIVLLLGMVMVVMLLQVWQMKTKVKRMERELQQRYRNSFLTSSIGSIGYNEAVL